MTKPTKIRSGGTVYLSEAIATDKTTKKVEYMGESYYAEKLPAEYVMLEGVAYKRLMSVADYNKKAVMEGSAPIKPAKKIRIKGTNTVLEAISNVNEIAEAHDPDNGFGSVGVSSTVSLIDKAYGLIEAAGRDIDSSATRDPRKPYFDKAYEAVYALLNAAKSYDERARKEY